MRGVGVTAAVAGAVPPALVPLVFLVTQLGDPWFLFGASVLAYWAAPPHVLPTRRDGVRLLAVVVTAVALVVALKYAFRLPRPPVSVEHVAAAGYGFPSGHATGAAAAYGAGVALFTWRTRRDRVRLAAVLVVLVCLSRLALGVHYLVDVAVGVPLGLAVAWGVLAATRRRVAYGFWLATAVGVAALAATAFGTDGVAVFGLALGATAAWTAVEHFDRALTRLSRPALFGGVVVAGGSAGVGFALQLPEPVVFAATAVAGAVVVALPAKK